MPPSPHSYATVGDDQTSPSVSVVLPALNEEDNLPHVLEGLPPLVDEVVVVDGGSVDDTVAIAREVRPDAVIVRQTRTGKGNALVCGFAAVTGDIVVTLNADGSADPGEIPRFVDALLSGAEVAHGSRYRAGGGSFAGSRWDDLGNRGLNTIVNTLFGTRFTDLAFGYNAFWRSLLPALDLPEADEPGTRRGAAIWGDGPEIEPLINIRMAAQGLRVVEVASIGYPPIHGTKDRDRLREGTRALKAVAAEWRRHRRANQTVAGRHQSRPGAAGHPGTAPGHRTDPAVARQAPAGHGVEVRPETSGTVPGWAYTLPTQPDGRTTPDAAGRDHAWPDGPGADGTGPEPSWPDSRDTAGTYGDPAGDDAAGGGRGREAGGRHAAPGADEDAPRHRGTPRQRGRSDGPAALAADARQGERRRSTDRRRPAQTWDPDARAAQAPDARPARTWEPDAGTPQAWEPDARPAQAWEPVARPTPADRPGGRPAGAWEADRKPELTLLAGHGESAMAQLVPGRRPGHLRAVSGEPGWR